MKLMRLSLYAFLAFAFSHVVLASALTVAPQYAVAPNWNDYVRTNGTTACDGTETTVQSCIHGGEARKVTTVQTSCDYLTLVDTLGVFDWSCSLSGGYAVFTSKLKAGKGLSNLIDVNGWVKNYVTLSKGFPWPDDVSYPGVWWTNPIQRLPDNSLTSAAQSALSSSGTIYFTDSAIVTSGYNVQADKVSVITFSSGTITRNAKAGTDTALDGRPGSGYRTAVSSGSQKFLWFEGKINLDINNQGGCFTLFLSAVKFSRIHNSFVTKGVPIYLYGASYNTLRGDYVSLSYDMGVVLDSSSGNMVDGLTAFQNPVHYGLGVGNASGNIVSNLRVYQGFGGIRLWSSTGANFFQNILISNVNSGIYDTYNNSKNVFTQVTIANVDSSDGFKLEHSDSQWVHNAVLVNMNKAIELAVSHSDFFSQVAMTNDTYGIYSYDGVSSTLAGNTVVGANSTKSCAIAYGSAFVTDPSCANAGSTVTSLTSGVAAAFVAKASSDSVNGSNTGATQSYDSITDWTGFLTPTRAWGLDGSSWPSSNNEGMCTTGVTCRIWDWALSATDTLLLNRSDAITSPNAIWDGYNCPAAVNATLSDPSSVSYAKNAMEIVTDPSGNHDGLCQAGEVCLYTPNLGAYQGHGDMVACNYSGSLTGVTMYLYLQNGR